MTKRALKSKLCAWCGGVLTDPKRRFCSLQCFGKARAQGNRKEPTPLPIAGAAWIPLAGGGFALVDDADFAWLSKFSWAKGGSRGQYVYTVMPKPKQFRVYMHQLLEPNAPGVDHKNGNGFDNRRGNLRAATQRQNSGNIRSRSKLTPYKGIAEQPNGTWNARIRMPDGARPSLGSFKTQEEAARAYDDAARRVHGAFACVNFPLEGERGAR